MSNIKISIITPVYNAGLYITDTYKSIIAQTYKNWEWLVVDDCSTDTSSEILQTLAATESRIKLLKNTTNLKAAATRNRALEHATGQFIAFLDADDLWTPNKLELQLNYMLQNDYCFTYTNFTRFKETPDAAIKIENLPPQATYNKIIVNNYIATSTVMIDVSKTGQFIMRDVYYDDFTLWLELLSRTPVAYGIKEKLMHYRLSENSLSRNKVRSAIKVYHIFTKNLGFSYLKSRYMFLRWVFNTLIRYLPIK